MLDANDLDLNDLRHFAQVVDAGGFAAAERVARITKSKLSRRVAALEAELGVQLLRRSTRRIALTEAGRALYEHCAALGVEAEAALEAVEQLRSEPAGTVRLSSPTALAQQQLARLLAEFMARHPKVRVELDATDRLVDLLAERVDLAVRAGGEQRLDPNLVARRIASGRWVLVASGDFMRAHPQALDPGAALAGCATIGSLSAGTEQLWELHDRAGTVLRLAHRPRLLCADVMVRLAAARAGVGIALLPRRTVDADLAEGTLLRVLPDWSGPEVGIHLLYARRRGMIPAVGALVDHLAAGLAPLLDAP
ncbi:MAG: LysR family transcriptional regulator [Betaproteobacteria bacterium]|nr:LysR family transcriptional regulator [Betaproteobacteria bacterium]MBU6512851.1 LysR family transcriptional regulator [Betaproteobacteria bacterium]MDE1956429.1 LysR family transcriptional regulator [Betaproteobacteria bacterium]MDE2477323.1 LysR family transcriptional regulator [Betaproteobacteria bacterium]